MQTKMALTLEMMNEMHAACVADNQQEKGVLKAFRMAGWLTTRPTKEGLVFLDGPVWNDFPNGSSRLAAGLLDTRIEGIRSQEGQPARPDWDQLKQLRNAQHHHNLDGLFEAELAAIKDEDAREVRRKQINEEWEATDELPVKGFLDLTVGGWGEAIFEDQQENQGREDRLRPPLLAARLRRWGRLHPQADAPQEEEADCRRGLAAGSRRAEEEEDAEQW